MFDFYNLKAFRRERKKKKIEEKWLSYEYDEMLWKNVREKKLNLYLVLGKF